MYEPDFTELADDLHRACTLLTSATHRVANEMERCGESHMLYECMCDISTDIDDALESAQTALETLP